MKWKEVDFNASLKSGLANVRAVLLFGPDAGQIDELSAKAIEHLEIDSNNLFVVDANDLKEKTESIFAEACSNSLLGGRRMIIIANAGDSDAKLIAELCNHPSLGAALIITAGQLRAGGGLRALFEDTSNLAAVGCYTDDEKALSALIQRELFNPQVGIKQITNDAMQYMCAHLGADRGITRSFLRKIILYVDDTKIVDLDAVEKCLPDTGAADLDSYLYSLTAGHVATTMTALDRLFFDGNEAVQLVRLLDIHFKKLLNAVVAGQMPIPKPFYKVADKFNVAMKIWPESEIVGVLTRLNELELQTKTTGMPGELLVRDFSLKLSVRAAKLKLKVKK